MPTFPTATTLTATTLTAATVVPCSAAGAKNEVPVSVLVGRAGVAEVVIEDQKAAGTDGGSASALTWNTRTLNTVVTDSGSLAALNANQVTLAAGTYRCWASAPANRVGAHKIRLRNVTAGATVLVGKSAFCPTASAVVTESRIEGKVFTVAAGQALELQHYTTSAEATDGLGAGSASGETEVFASVRFEKIIT